MNFILCIAFFSLCFYQDPLMENFFDLWLCYYFLCRHGNNQFGAHFRRIGVVSFLLQDGKDAVHEGRKGRRGVYFPPDLAFFPL